jgi:hypothetical protein
VGVHYLGEVCRSALSYRHRDGSVWERHGVWSGGGQGSASRVDDAESAAGTAGWGTVSTVVGSEGSVKHFPPPGTRQDWPDDHEVHMHRSLPVEREAFELQLR